MATINNMQISKINSTIDHLYNDSKNDYLRIIKSLAKSVFRPIQPIDLKDAYLAISQEQGKELVQLIKAKKIKRIIEFGTSFGISTLFLAKGARATGGSIITTELINDKAKKAIENFERAGVNDLIEVRVGDALDTLKNHSTSIDLLILDGWKNLYLPIFHMLEPNYHPDTIIYVDNADMVESQSFLHTVNQDSKYQIQYKNQGKVAMITLRN